MNVKLALLALFAAPALIAQTATLPIDTKASTLQWTGHAEVGTYAPQGTLAVSGGSVDIRNNKFAGATVTIDMKSLDQSNADLTHHLKSADFFDVDRFPTATLTLTKFAGGTVYGTLKIKDKTTPFQAPVAVINNAGRFLVTGNVTLDRTAYGIVYNSSNFFSGLGNKAIRNTFEVDFKSPAQALCRLRSAYTIT